MPVKNKYMAINQILRKNQVLSALKSCHFKSALFLLSGLMFSGVARSGLVMFWAEKEWMCQKSVLTRRTKVSPWQLAQHSGFSSWQKQKGLLGFLQGSHTFPPFPTPLTSPWSGIIHLCTLQKERFQVWNTTAHLDEVWGTFPFARNLMPGERYSPRQFSKTLLQALKVQPEMNVSDWQMFSGILEYELLLNPWRHS